MKPQNALFLIAALAICTGAAGQNVINLAPATGWQACAALGVDGPARLACFDQWASQQAAAPLSPVRAPVVAPVQITITPPDTQDCKNPAFSETSRFWELEAGSDCGTLGIRGYRPISLSWIGSDGVNTQPASPAADHTALAAQPYSTSETRIQLSVRTKIMQGLLTHNQALKRDSLWFGYTQQSYWQLFNGDLSRPFRTTDHEPEITYIYPTDAQLLGGWRWRYSGASFVHQSNGQTLPLSRSWNRLILMTGVEKGDQFRLQARLWKRLNEDPLTDDNPGISDLVGRGELAGFWNVNPNNTLGVTVRHSLRDNANGSVRLEWFKKVGDGGAPAHQSGLRLHTQLFSGYGDSLVDYNRQRTVLSVGLSLVDW